MLRVCAEPDERDARVTIDSRVGSDEVRGVTEVLSKSGDLAATLKNFRQTSEELKKAVGENRALLKTTVENFSAASQTTKRLTADREVELLFRLTGFSCEAWFGDYAMRRPRSHSRQLIGVGRKAAAGTSKKSA